MSVIAGSTHELYTCIFRQMARLLLKISRCMAYAAQPPYWRKYLFVLVLFLEAVGLSQVYVAFNISYHHIGMLSTFVTFVFTMFILRPIRLLSSDSSCSICCSSCGVSVHKNMASAKRRLVRNYPSIFTPLFNQFNLPNMHSDVAVNSLGEMVSPVLLLS